MVQRRLWHVAGRLAAAALLMGHGIAASQAEPQADATGAAERSVGRSSDPKKLSLEEQKKLLQGLYAAFWGFKMFVAGIVICILGLHGACCLFPNYKTGDAVPFFLHTPGCC